MKGIGGPLCSLVDVNSQESNSTFEAFNVMLLCIVRPMFGYLQQEYATLPEKFTPTPAQ